MRPVTQIVLVLAAGLLATPALSQTAPGVVPGPGVGETTGPHPTPSPGAKALTVGEVIDIAAALASLDAHQTGVVDRSGNPVTAPNNFIFPGATVYIMADDERAGRAVFTLYSEQVTKYRIKLAGAGRDVPKDKMDDFVRETNAFRNAPAGVTLSHIPLANLCLDVKLPLCPQRNAIPMSTVSVLLPIIDK